MGTAMFRMKGTMSQFQTEHKSKRQKAANEQRATLWKGVGVTTFRLHPQGGPGGRRRPRRYVCVRAATQTGD
jgi:DNA invertase Pin-like site-specific DNA recombinase